MNSSTASQEERIESFSIEGLAWEAVEEWSALCQRFLDWQRREILQREPSPEKLEQHRAGLKWLLRFAKAVYFTASDPDYPDRRLASELKGRIIQLEHSWRMVHEPMSQAEADQLLKDVFPE